jgi:hypothetical protein
VVSQWQPDGVQALLLAVEAKGHRAGWDNTPATVYLLYDERDARTRREYQALLARVHGPAVSARPWAAQPVARFTDGDMGGAAEQLFMFAAGLTGAALPLPVAKFLLVCRQPGFMGVAFMAESYVMEVDDSEMIQRLAGAPRPRLADTVGAVEARQVMAVDTDWHSHKVERQRGMPPTFHHLPPGVVGGDAIVGETVLVRRGLHLATAVIAGQPIPDELLQVPS